MIISASSYPRADKHSSDLPESPETELKDHKNVSDAYLCLSCLLTQNFIPHNPTPSRIGQRTIMLHGRPKLPEFSPSLTSQETSMISISQSGRDDALKEASVYLTAFSTRNRAMKRRQRVQEELLRNDLRTPGIYQMRLNFL